MKVEIIQSQDKSELDNLINACVQDRDVRDIKLTTAVLSNNVVQHTALIMLNT